MTRIFRMLAAFSLCGGVALVAQQQPPASQRPLSQPSQVELIIGDRIGAQPTFAVPDCLALTGDDQTTAMAKTIAEVLWSDLEFEREFRMLARDTYGTIPPARSVEDLPMARWRELGADGVVSCSVERIGDQRIRVIARLFNVRSQESAFAILEGMKIRLYARLLASLQRALFAASKTEQRPHRRPADATAR